MDAEEYDLLLDYIESQEQPETGFFEKRRPSSVIQPPSTGARRDDHVSLFVGGEGYDKSLFVGDPDDDLKCPICLAVAKDPVQTPCGHIFCDSCFKKLPRVNGSFECPQDRQKHHENKVFPDARTNRKILQLKVRCTMHKSGCQKQIELQYLEKHAQECGYVKVHCPDECGEKIRRSAVKDHQEKKCVNRKYKCELCHQEMTYYHYRWKHRVRFCKKISVTCSYCKQEMAREKLQRHRSQGTTGDCPKVPVSCEYRKLGCSFRGPREDMPLHMQNDIQKHMQLLLTRQKETDEKVLSLETYQKVKEPGGSFLWAIDNWPEVEKLEGPQLILSRKFKFAGKLNMRLQLVVERLEWSTGGKRTKLYALLLDRDRCTQLQHFSVLLVNDVQTQKRGTIYGHETKKMLVAYTYDKSFWNKFSEIFMKAQGTRDESIDLSSRNLPLHDNILLVRLEW